MLKLRLALGIGLLALANLAALAESDQHVRPLKPATVPERGFQIPFDLKTDSAFKFRGPESKVPEALAPTRPEHRPFFGMGISRPLETGQ